MRFFQKKDEINPVDVRRTQAQGHDFDSSYEKFHSSNSKSSDPSRISKRSIAELVKMLNCTAAKVTEEDFVAGEQSFQIGGNGESRNKPGMLARSTSWAEALRNSMPANYDFDITRPVLITIRDGDLGTSMSGMIGSSRYPSENRDTTGKLKTSFLIGPAPPSTIAKSSSFRFGTSARKRSTEKVSFAKMQHKSQTGASKKHKHDSPPRSHPTTHDKASSLDNTREIARKERWRRGLEMEKNIWRSRATDVADGIQSLLSSDYGAASTDGEDSIYAADDHSYFTHSTEGTSNYTEEDFSSLGYSSTEATETDESGDGSRYYVRKRNNRRSLVRTSSQYVSLIGMNEGHWSSGHQVMSEISEDFGIVANFLLADGTACLGTAAAITRETVSSCKPDPGFARDSYVFGTQFL
jgi:hypothetical protein